MILYSAVGFFFFGARGDGCSGKPTGRDGAMGFARRITVCLSVSHTLSLTPSNVNREIVPSSSRSDVLPARWLPLAPSPSWNWTSCVKRRDQCDFILLAVVFNGSLKPLRRRLLRLYSGSTGRD